MNNIYILEGADGTGKTTLANAISEKTKASIIHCSYDKEWDIKKYHEKMFECAATISKYSDVVIDRWALSELIYAEIFRNGASYNVIELMNEALNKNKNIKWVYCRNDEVVSNHGRNKNIRHEMYDDMTHVAKLYDTFVNDDFLRDWAIYDFNNMLTEDFVNKLIGG